MKKIGRGFVSLATSALASVMVVGVAQAADMPLKAPVPPVVSDWTGFYIGIHGGYGWADHTIGDALFSGSTSLLRPDLVLSPTSKLRGGVFGGHAGYNWQWAQRWVGGLEVDFSGADLKQSRSITNVEPNSDVGTRLLESKLDWLASARARLGFLLMPEFLIYGTGGAAWAHTKSLNEIDFDFAFGDWLQIDVDRANTSHFGWVAGAGGEWKMWNSHWLLRIEYLHYDFGNSTTAFSAQRIGTDGLVTNLPDFKLGSKLTTDVVRGGLSYKF